MGIYFGTIAVSAILFYLADKSKGCLQYGLAAISICVVCFIAGCRDITVGTDTQFYPLIMFNDAKSYSIIAYYPRVISMFGEAQPYGFTFITWIISRLVSNFGQYLFMLELIAILPVYIGLCKFNPNSTWVGMSCYLFMLFPFSLNGIKQCIAASFVFLAMAFYLDDSKRTAVILYIVACLMHQTAVLFIALVPLYLFICGPGSSLSPVKMLFMMIASFLLIATLVALGGRFVSFLGSLRESYSFITDHGATGANESGLIMALLIVLIHLMYLSGNTLKHECPNDTDMSLFFFLEYISLFGFFALQLGLVADGLSRIAFYCYPFLCCYLEKIPNRQSALTVFIKIVFIIFMAIYLYRMLISGSMGLYPYTSVFLGIR